MKVLTSRPMLGRLSMAIAVTVLPTVAFMVCSSTPVAWTSTTTFAPPTCRDKLRVTAAPTFTSCLSALVVANPDLLMEILYVPGLTSTKTYLPSLLVVVFRPILVEVSVTTTVAPGTTAPDGSVIVPAIVPVDVDCAQRGRAPPTQTNNNRRTRAD